MRRSFIALASALALVAITVVPATAITGSYRPDNEHPFVGLVAFYDDEGEFAGRCTGSLLSPTVLLTAGHCTDDGAGGVNTTARVWFLQDVGSHYDPATEHDNWTGYPDSCVATEGPLTGNGLGDWCAESDTMFNYGFDNFAGFPEIRDVGIVILDQPIEMDEYATLASPGTVDTLRTTKGVQDTTIRVSGYGISYLLDVPAGPGNGVGQFRTLSFRVRLQADSRITNLHNPSTAGYTIQSIGNGSARGGTCSGDSGGPVFWPSTSNQVVAVTSWGRSNAGCRGSDFSYRVDTTAVHQWIRSVVGEQRWSEIEIS